MIIMKELREKVAVVTGGGAGIGRAICMAFAKAGASVVIPDLNLENARKTSFAVEKEGVEGFPVEADVSMPDDVDMIFDKTMEAFDKVDILVNNAGTTHPTVSILDLDLDYVDRIFAIDYKGLYLCSRRAGREMMKQKSGCIINISSIAGLTPLPLVMYGPMKSAVNMLTKILAREWARYNIRVNAIAPGYVLTPLIQSMIEQGQRDPSLIIDRTPMKSMLDPRDIAEAVLFIASPRAPYITGTVLPVDAGWLTDGGWSAYNK
jgi:NAD(P)-dependent dehydrogenase (short-subunit alcohol dehydrogenase family)